MASATDNFNRTDGALGANWTANVGTFKIVSNRVEYDTRAATDPGYETSAHWSAASFQADQYSEVTLAAINGSIYAGAIARAGGNGVQTYYAYVANDVSSRIYRVVSNTWTSLGYSTAQARSAGDRLRIEVSTVGDSVFIKRSWYRDGSWTEWATALEDTHADRILSGQPGMMLRSPDAATPALDDWAGGYLVETQAPRSMHQFRLRR